MREYTLYFINKKRGAGILNNMQIRANTLKEAKELLKEKATYHPFSISTKAPVIVKQGLLYNDMIYTRAQYIDLTGNWILW